MGNKGRKLKLKRAPGAPLRFKSAYMFFSAAQHHVIRNNAPDKKMKSSEIAKIISRAWKNLKESEKAVWNEMAQNDRKRYDREKAVYKGPWKVPNIKDPDAPKKPMSAYLAFGNARRKAIAEANPSMNGTQISCLLAKLWRESSDEIKQEYRDREAHDRALYKQRRAIWEQQKKEDADCNSSQSSSSSSSSVSWPEPQTATTTINDSNNTNLMRLNEECNQSCFTFDYPSLPSLPNQSNPSLVLRQAQAVVSAPLVLPVVSPPSNQEEQTFPCVPQQTSSPSLVTTGSAKDAATRFDDYSLDDILNSDELFEDFSPMEAQSVFNLHHPGIVS